MNEKCYCNFTNSARDLKAFIFMGNEDESSLDKTEAGTFVLYRASHPDTNLEEKVLWGFPTCL